MPSVDMNGMIEEVMEEEEEEVLLGEVEEEEEVPSMDQEAVEGAMDDTNDGLGSNRKSDG